MPCSFTNFACDLSFVDDRVRCHAPLDTMTPLPQDWTPDNWSVICGRGRDAYNHIGNRRFRVLVDIHIPKYRHAASRVEKSIVVMRIVDTIRDCSGTGGFVKMDPTTQRWFEVGDAIAREKVGQEFRTAISKIDPTLHVRSRAKQKGKSAKKKKKSMSRCNSNSDSSDSSQGSASSLMDTHYSSQFVEKQVTATSNVVSAPTVTQATMPVATALLIPERDTIHNNDVRDYPKSSSIPQFQPQRNASVIEAPQPATIQLPLLTLDRLVAASKALEHSK